MKLRYIKDRNKRNDIINSNKARLKEIEKLLKGPLSKDDMAKLCVEKSKLKIITDDLEKQNESDDCKKYENTTPLPNSYKIKKKNKG